jgi:predicted deacylase
MDLDITIIDPETGGSVEKNKDLKGHISLGKITETLIKAAKKGTPLVRMGSGFPTVLLTAGVHGNELPPQAAVLRLFRALDKKKMAGTVYIIPFSIPYATMNNSRRFQGWDMNRKASKDGTTSYHIIRTTQKLNIGAVADFHSTQTQSNPGIESVFCSKNPCYESFKIATHITRQTSSKIISQEKAGTLYGGALEDELNLSGIPAVTCEVVSQNGKIDPGSIKRSYLQMQAFLGYFQII